MEILDDGSKGKTIYKEFEELGNVNGTIFQCIASMAWHTPLNYFINLQRNF